MSARAEFFGNIKNRDRYMLQDSQSTAVVDDAASQPFVGRWNRLVSTTNWEKGRIICEWRAELLAAGRPAADSSDEAWAERVGGVTGQHAGRLRRVFHRFGQVHQSYDGLYWSHFQAALDWSDAEMWLEGALQNQWSVAQMRAKRSETLGDAQQDANVHVEWNDDESIESLPPERITGTVARVRDLPADENDEFDDTAEASASGSSNGSGESKSASPPDRKSKPQKVPSQPFANVPELPDDLAGAVETFKLAIVRHRLSGWREVTTGDVLAALNALRELTLAPLDQN
jgi:hypothetical protein